MACGRYLGARKRTPTCVTLPGDRGQSTGGIMGRAIWGGSRVWTRCPISARMVRVSNVASGIGERGRSRAVPRNRSGDRRHPLVHPVSTHSDFGHLGPDGKHRRAADGDLHSSATAVGDHLALVERRAESFRIVLVVGCVVWVWSMTWRTLD